MVFKYTPEGLAAFDNDDERDMFTTQVAVES